MQVTGFKWNSYKSYKSLLDAEIAYNDYIKRHEKLTETSNMLETTKFIVETLENGLQTEVPTCNKAVQTDKGRNDCIILSILSIHCMLYFRDNRCYMYFA